MRTHPAHPPGYGPVYIHHSAAAAAAADDDDSFGLLGAKGT